MIKLLDILKYDYLPTIQGYLLEALYEIELSTKNAVETNNNEFTVGNIEYTYNISQIQNPYQDSGSFYSVQFNEKNNTSEPNTKTGNAKENYIKILSTMYKIINDFATTKHPDYIGLSTLDKSGYWNVYNTLTKTNSIPGYTRKDAGLKFTTKNDNKDKFIVLKRVK
jgi:hypothetical protein